MDHAIETENLTCRYGRTRAVADLTMRVPTGSIYALLGPNGAGKTTTLKALMNLRQPASGVARVLGVDSRALGPADLARIGYVSESQGIPPNLTIGEIEAFCRPWSPTWDAELAAELRERFGLDPRARIKSLSRGTRLKVQCLLALAPRPRLLILDEPFSGLDPVGVDKLASVLQGQVDQGTAVVFSSHQLELVERLSDEVTIIDQGRMVASGHVDDVRRSRGAEQIRVELEDGGTAWAAGLAGVRVAGRFGDEVVLELVAGGDDQEVLDAARAAGRVRSFRREAPSLSELFREVVSGR